MATTAASHHARSLVIWICVVLIALIAVFIGIDSASKQTPASPAPTGTINAVQNDDHITGGSVMSSVTLIEYSDFQCPACGAYYPLVKKLVAHNSATVRFVYRYFPLQTIHRNAELSARAAEAAGKQGKFWEMHDMLFKHQNDWAEQSNARDIFIGYARNMGINTDTFSADTDSASTQARIDRDYQSGITAGIEGTPTFFLNGKAIHNPQSYDEFQKLIDDAVARSS